MTTTELSIIDTATTLANGHAPKRARSKPPADTNDAPELTALKSAKLAAEARRKALRAELTALDAELGNGGLVLEGPASPGGMLAATAIRAPATTKPKHRKPKPIVITASAAPKPKAERAKRGSKQTDATTALAQIIERLQNNGASMRSEELREALSIDKSIIGIALKRGVESGQLETTGRKRATAYRAAQATEAK